MKFLILIDLGLVTALAAFPATFASTAVRFNGHGTGTFTDRSPTSVLITGTGYYEHLGIATLTSRARLRARQDAADSRPWNKTPTLEQMGSASSRQYTTQTAQPLLQTCFNSQAHS
ncbi:MAG TPA: hypothetical protein VNA15_09810 [Candidatus Angelobacter sp.]|nr:hypothetical protein [Candidatus Angelobacter sp.]